MSNEDDNIDLDDESFDEFDDSQGTLGDTLRENSLAKIGIIAGAIIAIFAGIILFGGGDEGPANPSYVAGGSDVSTPPGAEGTSQVYIDTVRDQDEREREEAERTGGSAMPTPLDAMETVLVAPEPAEEEEDPLLRWRQLQEERLKRELEQAQTVEPIPAAEVDTGRGDAVRALADLMAQQMQAILDSQNNPINSVTLTSTEEFLTAQQEQALALAEQQAIIDEAEAAEEEEETEEIVLPAGEIEYAQLLIEANSDVPGPVLAQIVSGPLNGSRIIGSFQRTQEPTKLLTLNFNSVVLDGETVNVNAVALDPGTSLPGMATDVDNRYFQRIVLPAAAAFVEGAAEAISESGLTTVTIEGETVAEETEESDTDQEVASGITEAAQELRDILDDEADVEPLIRIEAGTPMGLLFLEPVVR